MPVPYHDAISKALSHGRDIHPYNLCTSVCENSLFCKTVEEWNLLFDAVVTSDSWSWWSIGFTSQLHCLLLGGAFMHVLTHHAWAEDECAVLTKR